VRGRRLTVNAAEERPGRSQAGAPPAARPPFDFAGGGSRRPERRFKSKGSRRGLRGRKRSL